MLSILTAWTLAGGVAIAADDGPSDSAQADDARARELWENGAILYSEGRYEDAIRAFQEAYRLSQRPVILTNIANAQERVGAWEDALDSLNRYRAYAPADERGSLDRRIANLERRLAEQQAAGASAPTPAPAPAAGSSRGVGLPVALLVGGVAGLGAGATFGVLTLGVRADAEALCVTAGDGFLCPDAAADALQRDRRYSLLADVGVGAGAVLVAAGVATLVAGRNPDAPVVAVLSPAPGGGLVVLTGGF